MTNAGNNRVRWRAIAKGISGDGHVPVVDGDVDSAMTLAKQMTEWTLSSAEVSAINPGESNE